MEAIEHVDQLHNHWWWRPGWHAGRHFYACHITLDDQPDLRRLAATYQGALADLDGLDLIPAEWLHMTLHGVGFVDQVSPGDADAVLRAVSEAVAGVQPPTVTFGQVVVRPEAVYLPAEPAAPLVGLRDAVHSALVEMLGADRVEPLGGYRPHMSVAYANRDQPAAPIVAALEGARVEPVEVTVRRLSWLVFHRDYQMYQWTDRTPIPLGPAQAT